MTIDQKVLTWIELTVLIGLVLVFSWATYNRNLMWNDEVTLWSDVVAKSPHKARCYNNLGRCYLSNKEFAEALPYIRKALQLNPYSSYAHYNLGIAYQGLGLCDNAIAAYKTALRGLRKPYFAKVHNNMGTCYFKKGQKDMAIAEFKKALEINPSFSDARFNLDAVLKSKD
jgi:tetratricopeptide (TPR) repeat protein